MEKLENFNTSNVKKMNGMFRNCSKLTELDLSNFDTSKVFNMAEMFINCSNLINLDMSKANFNNLDTYFKNGFSQTFQGVIPYCQVKINKNQKEIFEKYFTFLNSGRLFFPTYVD